MKNAFSTNAALQITTIISGVIFFPFYFELIGSKQYYAVTLFLTMQAWFVILDLGMSPAIARVSALCTNEKKNLNELIFLIRKSLFVILLISLLIVISSFIIAKTSLRDQFIDLPPQIYFTAIFVLILKWLLNFNKFILNGLNSQTQANLILIILEFSKHFSAILLMTVSQDTLGVYFLVILTFTILQTGSIFFILLRTIPLFRDIALPNLSFVTEHVRLACALAGIGMLGVFTSQTDRSLIMMFLTLDELSYFAVILMFLNGLNAMQAPLYQTLVPRMTQRNEDALSQSALEVYSQFALYTVFVTSLIVFFVTVYSHQLIYWWSGNSELTTWVTDVIFWFGLIALANNLSVFAFFLQTAIGKFKYHYYGSVVNFMIQVPIVLVFGKNFGFVFAITVLSVFRCIWALLWVQFIHVKFKTNLSLEWFKPLILIIGMNYIVLLALDVLFKDQFILGCFILFIYTLSMWLLRGKINKQL